MHKRYQLKFSSIKTTIFNTVSLCVASQAFYLACHPSKDPEFFDLYSSNKFYFLLILSVISISFFYFGNLYKQNSNVINNRLSKLQLPSQCFGIGLPFFLALSVLLISYLINLNTSFSTGVDFATQLKAILQWDEGLSNRWNCIVNTDLESLSNDKEAWLFRPPGAILYYLPFMQLPIALGESLRIAQLILCVVLLFCWLEITKILKHEIYLQIILAFILSLWLSTFLSFVGNIQLLAATYSSVFTLIALKFCLRIKDHESFQFRNYTFLFFISLCLGVIVFIKASSVIYNCSILLSVIIFLLWKRIRILKLTLISISSITLFCCPYFILTSINAANGVELNDIYNQDYNNQIFYQELWGEYFTETTKIPAILLSFSASFSTFSPFILAQTLISNFLTYIGLVDDFIFSIHLNPKVIYKGVVGTIFSLALAYCFLRFLNLSGKISLIFTSVLAFPFIIFAYLANKHGYNYLIDGSYNEQFIPLFCLLILIVSFNLLKNENRKALLLAVPIIFFSVGLFSFSNTCYFFGSLKNRFEQKSLSSSHIGHPFFGDNHKMLDDTILKHRKSDYIPIIYLGNSSIQEMSIAYKGRYSGIGNVTEQLKNSNFLLPSFSKEALIIIDARLKDHELQSLSTMIFKNKHSYLLNLSETAKVILISG